MVPPYARGGYEEPRGSTLGDLIGRRGQIEAQRHAAGSDILGNAVAQVGQQLAGYFSQRAEKQEQAKREAATMAAIEGWDGQDPMKLFGSLRAIRPDDALQYTNTVLSLRRGPQQDPEKELERFGKTAQFLSGLDDETLGRAWPVIRQSLGPTAARMGLEAGEQWDPKYRPVLARVGDVFGPKKERKLTRLAPGEALYDESTDEIVAKGPAKEPPKHKVTVPGPGGRPVDRLVTEEELAKGVETYVAPKAPREAKEEQLVQVDVNGVPTWVPRSQAVGRPAAQAPRAVTGAERQALAYYNRGRQALEDISPLEEKVKQYGPVAQGRLAMGGMVGNLLQSAEQQKYRQAQRAFTEARLRKESGAAVPESEYENDARTYFAQPGDSPEVLDQKRAARERVLNGMGYASGKAYQEWYGEPMATPRTGAQEPSQRHGGASQARPQPPKAGDVVRGYRFKGGDPSDPASWEKAR